MTMGVSVVQKWSQPSNHMCFTPQQPQQYILALNGFFAVAELEALRLWVLAALVSGHSTISHSYIVKCRFWALMACYTKV